MIEDKVTAEQLQKAKDAAVSAAEHNQFRVEVVERIRQLFTTVSPGELDHVKVEASLRSITVTFTEPRLIRQFIF